MLTGLLLCTATITRARKGASGHEQLHFIENKVQITGQHLQARPDIAVKVQADNGLNMCIGAGAILDQWAKPIVEDTKTNLFSQIKEQNSFSYELHRMDVVLLGADPEAAWAKGAHLFFVIVHRQVL